jgi:hypothetical protein
MFKSWISHDSGTVKLPGDLMKPLFSTSTVPDPVWVLGHKRRGERVETPILKAGPTPWSASWMNEFLEEGQKRVEMG